MTMQANDKHNVLVNELFQDKLEYLPFRGMIDKWIRAGAPKSQKNNTLKIYLNQKDIEKTKALLQEINNG